MNPGLMEIWWQAPALFAIGILVGINNVLAGGGSLITMPILIFMGLDSATANGTNRLAVAIQNTAAVAGFRKKRLGDIRFSLLLALPAIPGVIAGAITANHITDETFRKVLAAVMLISLFLILRRKESAPGDHPEETSISPGRKILSMIMFAGIGFYSGFIQAGTGFLIIAGLSMTTHIDLIRINAHKVFIIGIFTWIAVAVFVWYHSIAWSYALALSMGNAAGGWLGTNVAVAGGEKWIKRILTVSVIAMALKLCRIF